jgi:membrane protein
MPERFSSLVQRLRRPSGPVRARAGAFGGTFGTGFAVSPLMDRQIDWKALPGVLAREVKDDRISNGAAALAFYMVLALFPAAIFGLSLLAYLPIDHLQRALMDLVRQTLPSSAAQLLTSTVESVAGQRSGGLLWFGVTFALLSASNGFSGIMQQLNVVYEVDEARSFLRARAISIVLTLAFFALGIGALALVVFGGVVQSYLAAHLGWTGGLRLFFSVLRWAIIVLALQFAFAIVYYLGPNLEQPFAPMTAGSGTSTVLLLLASIGFKFYVVHFGTYDVLYGSIGAVIVLLIWLFVAGWVMLFGAEVDDVLRRHRAERQPTEPKALRDRHA